MKEKRTAKLYKTDGQIVEIVPKNGRDFKIEELHKYIGGWIETAQATHKDYIIICDEEGKLKNLPLNIGASYLLSTFPMDMIVGDAIVCHHSMLR